MRMVADHFEMAGWDTHFVGASTPVQAIVDLAAKRDADVVALSATMTYHVPEVAETIEALKADERTADTPIIVGGYPFNLVPDLYRQVGADGYAPDARQAIETATRMLKA
jgi:methanogenic corrinoid protein MtbC1